MFCKISDFFAQIGKSKEHNKYLSVLEGQFKNMNGIHSLTSKLNTYIFILTVTTLLLSLQQLHQWLQNKVNMDAAGKA